MWCYKFVFIYIQRRVRVVLYKVHTVHAVLMMQLQEQSLPVRHTGCILNTLYKHLLPSASLIYLLLLTTSVNLSKWCPQFHPSSRWVRLCWVWLRTSPWLFLACCLLGIRCPRGSGCTTTAWWGHRQEFDFFTFFFHILHTLTPALGWIKRISFNLHSVRWPQTSMCQWGGMAVCILREFGWMMRVTTPAWLRTLSGPPTTQPLSTFTVTNIRTHKISTQTSAWSHYPPTNQTSIRFSIEISCFTGIAGWLLWPIQTNTFLKIVDQCCHSFVSTLTRTDMDM